MVAWAALWLVSAAGEIVTFQEFAVVGMALSVVLFCFGWTIAKQLAFPLLFLFFMVPIGDFLIPPLQSFTAEFSVGLLRLSGVAVFRDGNLIQIPSGMFLVAEACAGLRFLIANVVIATLFCYLAYVKWWKRCLFMVIAAIIPILANGVRAFGIMYLANLTDNRIAAGADHVIYGWGFFSVVMLTLLAIGSSFADRSARRGTPTAAVDKQPGESTEHQQKHWQHTLAAVAGVILLAAPVYAWFVMRPPISVREQVLMGVPIVSTWHRLPSVSSDWQPRFPGADLTSLYTYRNSEDIVDVFVAYYKYQRRGAEVVYYANSMADERTWWPYDTSTAMVHQRDNLIPSRVDDLASSTYHRIVVWWFWVDGQITSSAVRAKLLQTRAGLVGGTRAAAAIAVSVKYDGNPIDAIAAADRFLRDSAPLDEYLAGLSEQKIGTR
jgi:exosortase A